jgi:hypothetical protein
VISRATAEIARQPVADFLFGRIGVFFEQRFRRDQQTRCADAALQRNMIDELPLQRM